MKKTNYLSEIKPYHFNELISNSLSLDMIYCLEMVGRDIDVEYFFKDNIHGLAIIQGLNRRGYIKNGILTEEGTKLLLFVSTAPEKRLTLKGRTTISDEEFDRFWNSYPGTDNVIKEGKIIYKGTRALRKGNKQDIRVKLSKILAENKYKLDDIIAAIKFEVDQKTSESIKRRENKLTYMQNIDTYINQRSFEAYVEVAKLSTGYKEQETKFITDI